MVENDFDLLNLPMTIQNLEQTIRDITDSLILPDRFALPMIVEGKGCLLRDTEGKEYVDCACGQGAAVAGHSHPEIVEALKSQIEKLCVLTAKRWHEPIIELAKIMKTILPKPLSTFYICNTGAEAVEVSVKLAKKHAAVNMKSGSCVASLENSFHGLTALALTLTGQKYFKKKLGNFASYPGIEHLPSPYCYRCPLGLKYPDCGIACAQALESLIQSRGADDIAAVIYEPLSGTGGMIIPPPEYHDIIRKITRENGIPLIVDEVFCGFGRTGKMFASQHWNIEPDMMSAGKSLGGGFPIGAFMARREIAQSFTSSDHSGTFSTNPFTCSAALATLRVIQKEQLDQQAAKTGAFMMQELSKLKETSKLVGEIRGLGLAIGIELVKDHESKEPATAETKEVQKRLLKEGVLVATSGAYNNVVRINPPLNIEEKHAQKILTSVYKCLKELQ